MKQDATFGDLKLRVRRLQIFSSVLVGVIAIVPPSIFVVEGITHIRQHVSDQAVHVARLITPLVNLSRLDVQAASSLLEQEMPLSGITSVRLSDHEGKEILRLGWTQHRLILIEGTSPLTIGDGRLGEVRVAADERLFLYRAGRVVGIHLLVAVLLGLAIYRLGARPLTRAVGELDSIQAQLIHSEKLGAIGEVYAGVAHEINNPLAIVLSKVEIMLRAAREKQFSPDMIRDLEMIHRHATRIVETVRQLLTFARRASFELTNTDLNHVIEETVSLIEKTFSHRGIRLECKLDQKLPHIAGSPTHLQQVFLNLLNNARDAMPQGGVITIRTYWNRLHVVAEVQDSGTGIAPEIEEKIFEPFFTTKDVGKGSGLGLSVSYGIVKSHGGDIEVEGNWGRGALFRVSLPLPGKRQ